MWEGFRTDSGLAGWRRGNGERLCVVLHGGPGMTDYTESVGDEVAAGGDGSLRVARFQQRGQPPSTTEGELSVDQQVADVLAVIDHFAADRAIVAGHSWGGHLAMHVAVAAPERVEALLLIDPLGAVGDGGAGRMGSVIGERIGEAALKEIAAIPERGLDPVAAATAQCSLMWPGYFSDPAAAPPMPPIELSATVNSAVMSDAVAKLQAGLLAERLPTLNIPSLHMVARNSPIDPDAMRASAAIMRGAIVEEFDTGHFIWMEQPGAVEAAARRLLTVVP